MNSFAAITYPWNVKVHVRQMTMTSIRVSSIRICDSKYSWTKVLLWQSHELSALTARFPVDIGQRADNVSSSSYTQWFVCTRTIRVSAPSAKDSARSLTLFLPRTDEHQQYTGINSYCGSLHERAIPFFRPPRFHSAIRLCYSAIFLYYILHAFYARRSLAVNVQHEGRTFFFYPWSWRTFLCQSCS